MLYKIQITAQLKCNADDKKLENAYMFIIRAPAPRLNTAKTLHTASGILIVRSCEVQSQSYTDSSFVVTVTFLVTSHKDF